MWMMISNDLWSQMHTNTHTLWTSMFRIQLPSEEKKFFCCKSSSKRKNIILWHSLACSMRICTDKQAWKKKWKDFRFWFRFFSSFFAIASSFFHFWFFNSFSLSLWAHLFFLSSTSTTIIVIITTFKIFCSIHLLHSFSIFLSIHYYLNGNGIRHDYSQKEKTKIFPLITFSGNNIESNCIIIAEGKIWKWIHSFIQYFFCNGHQKNTETMRNQIDWKQKRFSIIFPHSLIIIRVVYIWSFKKNHEEKPKQSGNYLNRMVYFRLEN